MRVAVAQFCVRYRDVAANVTRIGELIGTATTLGADLLCLPEMAVTGYVLEPGFTVDLSAAHRAVHAAAGPMKVAYGFPRTCGTRRYNTIALTPGLIYYDKVHLDDHEATVFQPGDALVVQDDAGIALACCYDVSFPEHARALALAGARLMCLPMAWETRCPAVMTICSHARAVENQLFVARANQVGRSGPYTFAGQSAIIHPDGTVLCDLGTEEGVGYADVDLADTGSTYPFFRHRRAELYQS